MNLSSFYLTFVKIFKNKSMAIYMSNNYLIYLILFLFMIYLFKNIFFKNVNEAFGHTNKRCSAIYGNYHPKCAPTTRLNHVGYFKYNLIKYPLIDFNDGVEVKRFVMLKDKFVKLNQKYWNKGYYFKSPFYYHKNVPFSFVMNFTYRGIATNNHNNKQFYIFGKRLESNLYKYVLFSQKDSKLQFAYVLPPRIKIKDGDSIYVKNKVSVFGPFVFYKN